jgi:hypothetical protein
MKNTLFASVALLTLAVATPAFAQDVLIGTEAEVNSGAAVGATGGGVTGAVVGGLIGGPIGAVIGGFAGATIGAEAGVEASSVDYVVANPVEPIYLDGAADVGFVVPANVTVYPIQGDPAYGYVYANDRVWIVDMQTRAFVQSPGYLVPQTSADFVVANPVAAAQVQGDVVVGYVVPNEVQLTPVPQSRYSYIYIGDQPALVDTSTRAVVWLN